MHKKILSFVICLTFILPFCTFSAEKIPAMIVAPFIQTTTLTNHTNANVNIIIQNNTGTNLTITNLVPQIPSGSIVSATIIDNHCGLLAPQATCDATAQLGGLTKPGNENLNISVCAFGGALCSRIVQPITVTNAALVGISVSPTDPSIISNTTQQFYATGIYADNSIQDISNSVTWSSSDQTKATISNTSGSQGLASGLATGTSTISAALNGVSGSTTLTINAATLSSITIIPAHPSIAIKI